MKKELKEAIKYSGNNLHLAVVEFLDGLKWETDLSAYYCDDITDKPREIDIIASKDIFYVNSGPGNPAKEYRFSIYLFIECKNFRNEIAFRMQKNNAEDAKSAIITTIPDADKDVLLKQMISDGCPHHYLTEKTAKLYDTYKNKNEKTTEEVFNAITQPIKALIFSKNRIHQIKKNGPNKAFFYPLVVYYGISGFYLVNKSLNTDKDLDKVKVDGRDLIFGLNYSYSETMFNVAGKRFTPRKPFYVDFIHFDNIGTYLEKTIQRETNEIRSYFQNEFNLQRSKEQQQRNEQQFKNRLKNSAR